MKNLILLSLILLYFPAKAQIQFNSLEDLLNYADEHSIAIKTAQIGEQAAITAKKEANSYLLPTLNASLGFNDNITLQPTLVPAQMFNPEAPDDAFEEFTFGTKYNYSRSIQAQWDVLNFQKIFAIQTASVETEKSKINTEVSRYNTYHSLASTYYSILLTQESIELYKENVEVAEAILALAEEKYQKGIISEAELNQAKINKLQNQRSLTSAKNNLNQFFIQLQSQLNTEQKIVISDDLKKFSVENTSIQSVHPEVRLQEMEVKKYQSLLKQNKALRYPSLSLVYQNNETWATNDFMNFSDANDLPQQFFGVTLSMSNLLGFTAKQKVRKSKWELELQEIQLENTILVKQKEDELLELELKQTSDQLAENKDILELQQQNDVHAENQYQSGIMSLDQRLNKYDDLLAAQDGYLQSLAAFTLAQYKIYIRQMNFNLN